MALGKFGLGKYGSGQIWPGQTWVWANLASGKFGSGQTWAGAKVAGQTWSGKIWFGQTWDVIHFILDHTKSLEVRKAGDRSICTQASLVYCPLQNQKYIFYELYLCIT